MIPIFANQYIEFRFSTQENVTIIIRGQVKTPSGIVVPIYDQYVLSGVTSGTVLFFTKTKNVLEGELLTLSIVLSTIGIQRGQCYSQAKVINSDGVVEAICCAGYITSTRGITLGFFEDSQSGRGYITNTLISTPVAGADISLILDTNKIYRFIAFKFKLSASGVAANRQVYIYLALGGAANFIGLGAAVYLQPASTNIMYWFTNNCLLGTQVDIGGTPTYRMERVTNEIFGKAANFTLNIRAANIDVGDQFSLISFFTETWIKS